MNSIGARAYSLLSSPPRRERRGIPSPRSRGESRVRWLPSSNDRRSSQPCDLRLQPETYSSLHCSGNGAQPIRRVGWCGTSASCNRIVCVYRTRQTYWCAIRCEVENRHRTFLARLSSGHRRRRLRYACTCYDCITPTPAWILPRSHAYATTGWPRARQAVRSMDFRFHRALVRHQAHQAPVAPFRPSADVRNLHILTSFFFDFRE